MPVASPPIPNGCVHVENGRVTSVHGVHGVHAPHAEHIDLGDSVLLPGLINTHAHLELTMLRGLVTAKPFPRWVGTIKRLKERLTSHDYRAASRCGVLEHFAAGITTIGDTGSSGEPARAMAELGAGGVAYQEVFGPDPAQCAESMAGLCDALARLSVYQSARLSIGVSPHAPYTVSRELLADVSMLAEQEDRRVAMHVAESPEESRFVTSGEGPFADNLRGRGIAIDSEGLTPVDWALRHGLQHVAPLLIHCVHATPADLDDIAAAGATVAHCPWSNAALEVGAAPLAAMLQRDIPVGLGTDSVAAGRTIDLFEEMRLAAPLIGNDAARLLALATVDAALALGVADTGVIAEGAWADLCAVSLKEPVRDPVAHVVARARAADVTHTWVEGRLVYDRGSWPGIDHAAEHAELSRAESKARSIS